MTADRTDVERQLEKILASPDFESAARMRRLLRYLVEAELRGEGAQLKGYTVGVEVFDRDPSFDPATDSIVRVQIGRLRRMLDQYFATIGRDDSFRISIPKGGCQALIAAAEDLVIDAGQAEAPPSDEPDDAAAAADTEDAQPAQEPAQEEAFSDSARDPSAHPALPETDRRSSARRFARPLAVIAVLLVLLGGWAVVRYSGEARSTATRLSYSGKVSALSLAVLPIVDMSSRQTDVRLTDALTDNLTTTLSKVSALFVASRSTAFLYRGAADLRQVGLELGVAYLVEGSVQRLGDHVRLNIQLIDAESGAQIWAQIFDLAGENPLSLQDELVTTVALELQIRLYGAAKKRLAELPPEQVDPSDLALLANWAPGAEATTEVLLKERISLLERAVAIDPTLGAAHAVLADQIANLSKLDSAFNTPEMLEKAREHARRARVLAPSNAQAVFNLAAYAYHMGDTEEALATLQRVLELNPNYFLAKFSQVYMIYACAKPPDAVYRKVVDMDASLAADNPARWLTQYGLARFQLAAGELEEALAKAQASLQVAYVFKTAITYAAVLERLGRSDEAMEVVRGIKEDWPNVDLRQYAEVGIAERCPESPEKPGMAAAYRKLADRWEAETDKAR